MLSIRVGALAALILCINCGKASPNHMERLKSTDPEVRRQAAVALGKARDTSAFDALVEVMKTDESDEVRGAAIRAVGALGDPRATPALLEIVSGTEALDLRGSAVNALGDLRDPRSIPDMIAIWKLDRDQNDNGVIQAGVGFTLVAMAPVSYDPLIAALRDDHPKVRGYAANTLGLIGDSRAAAAITPLLDDPDILVISQAETALARLATP
jgi:HEAT repeat protein